MTGPGHSPDNADETVDWSDPSTPDAEPRPAEDASRWAEACSPDDRDAFEALAEEFAERCRHGESPSIAEYEERYPEHVERIRRLLPTVAMMEGLKRESGRTQNADVSASLPERLGEFRVVREIGRGGMGIVYEAVQESLGRHVALKLVPRLHLDARKLQRFQREAEAVAQLHHTNIVPIFGVGEQDGLPFYVMQLIRGTGLDALLGRWRREGPPREGDRWRFAARVGMQAARAIQYAHEQGILHRDIKPANLLIDEQDTVWITDFGLAKLTGQDDLTGSGDIVGTLRYLAPESLRGASDRRSDVYGLGLTLYELLTLSPPFGELSPSELLRHVGEEQPVRPRALNPSIPRDLETIVLKAIAKEPAHRYAAAGDLADDLQCFLEDRPIRARRVSPIERAWRWARRNRLTAALSAAAVGAVLLAAVVGWAGYASTSQALRQSRANEELSLAIFERLFDRLGTQTDFLPPPVGRSARRLPPPSRRTNDTAGLSGLRKRPAPRPADGESESPRRPEGPGPRETPDLLRDILTFYDRFARQNSANPRLQVEAAWAYRRVGAICESQGQTDDAERAYTHAITMLEALVAQYPHVADYRAKLVEAYIMANPWTADPSTLARMEARLRRAEAHGDRLAAESPGNADWLQAQVHVQGKLGTALRRSGRLDEAETHYRRAIELSERLLDREPTSIRARMDRADTREALALLEVERGRHDGARELLQAAATELQSLASAGPMPSLADRFEDLVEDYRGLGDSAQAEELSQWADRLRDNRPAPPRPPDREPARSRPPARPAPAPKAAETPRPNSSAGLSPTGVGLRYST